MAQSNDLRVQVSADAQTWYDLTGIQTAENGTLCDFVHWVPGAPGVYYLRVWATDNNGLPVGRTTLIALAANR